MSTALAGSSPSCSSSVSSSDVNSLGAPVGSTAYSYDVQGDIISTTVDAGDSGANADPQTTTASFDAMGNDLWSIPATGQSLVQSSSNPFATSTTYSAADVPMVVTAPYGDVTSNKYDAALNLTSSATPAATTTVVYDGDNRPCYSVVASSVLSGLSCSSPMQAGATATSYEPGSQVTASVTDANGNTTSYYYADLAYPSSATEVVDALGTEITYGAYDDFGNQCLGGDVAPTLGAGQCAWIGGDTATAHNALDVAVSVTDPNGNQTLNYYEDASFPTTLTRTVNALGQTTTYRYDADGRLLTEVKPNGDAITQAYNANGELCSKNPTSSSYPCGEGPSVAGVTQFSYNDANELVAMNDQVGSPASSTQWEQTTSYTYSNGQLLSTTDANAKTVSYSYNDAGEVACVSYPVAAASTCGTASAPATPSVTNTIVDKTYDSSGRLTSTTDWLGNTVTYTYADANDPSAVTKITYPATTGLAATYAYDNAGNLSSLTAGSSINDSWTYNADEQQRTATLNGSSSAGVTYNANKQVTAATNLGLSTSNDQYTLAPNAEILADRSPSGASTDFSYNAGDELCNASTSAVPCASTPTNGTSYSYTLDGQRASASTYTAGSAVQVTDDTWNSYGELCAVAPTSTSCGVVPSSGVSYSYNGMGLRTLSATSTSSTVSTWDSVSGGSLPLDLNDATSTSSAMTNTSYLYGDLLFGGSAPVEQITTNQAGSSAVFLVTVPSGVQGVVSSTGAVLELALYSPYGTQTLKAGSVVTPFGFEGAYTDSTGLLYLINRYYDPTTDSFISVDPKVQQTDQPYAFVNDDPLNGTDPLGLCWICKVFTSAVNSVAKVATDVGEFVNKYKTTIALAAISTVAIVATGGVAGALLVEGAAALDTLTATAEVAESGAEAGDFGELLGAATEKLSALTDLGVTAVKTALVLTVPAVSLVATVHEAEVTSKSTSTKKK